MFSGFGLGAGEVTQMTFVESGKYRQNLDLALKLLETGMFFMYVLTPEDTFSLELTEVYVLLVLDAGK